MVEERVDPKYVQIRTRKRHMAWKMREQGATSEEIASLLNSQRGTIIRAIEAHRPHLCQWCKTEPPTQRVSSTTYLPEALTTTSAWRTHRWWRKEGY